MPVGLSHLHKYKFRHNFQGSLDPPCNLQLLTSFPSAQINNIKEKSFSIKLVTENVLYWTNDETITKIFLFGSNGLNEKENALITESTVEYIITTEGFTAPLLWAHLIRSLLFLESLIGSGSPYFIFFNCLVFSFSLLYICIYIYIYTYIYIHKLYICRIYTCYMYSIYI